ncbi:MAG TPA: threonine-phosphate decarboxylase CobD [Geobacteraceae bacterium]|nr:threonine-phosphate decarboxylase CobD [Geobacteraceae bacterium]
MKTKFDHGGNVLAVARSLGVSPAEILDFSASINPLGPAVGVREALADAFDTIVHYPDSDCSALREALALSHGVKSANICVANGSTELIYLLPRLVHGKRALLIAPSFSEYARSLARDNCQAEYLVLQSTDGFSLTMDQLAERLHEGYDICILGNPGNPTGRLYPLVQVKEFFHLCRSAGSLLVVDEAFMDFSEDESAKHIATDNDGILILRSMTKFYSLPGLRLGYAIASELTTERISALREPWSVNTPAQAAGIVSLAAEGYADSTRRLIAAEREHLSAGLAAIPGLRPFPSAANYLLVEISKGPPAWEVASRLRAQHILIRDCSNFTGLDGRFIRVAVRSPSENERLISALASAIGQI